MTLDVDALAQEIRRVDGNHSLGAGQLAEALMPFFRALPHAGKVSEELWALCYLHDWNLPAEGQEHRWEPGKNVFPQVHAFYTSWHDAEAIRKDMTNPEKYWVVCARPEDKARMEKARAALSSQQTEAVPVAEPAIKALEWHDREDRDEDGGTDVVGSRADAELVQYWTGWDYRHEDPYTLFCGTRLLGRFSSEKEAKAAAQAHLNAAVTALIVPATSQAKGGAEAGDDETYEIGKRDGYSEAVQQIDVLTGGDGEYRFCTDCDPDRHTPDPDAMIRRIVDRFEAGAKP